MLLRLAWRNIWRNQGRSLMTLGAVAVVVIITMVFFSFTGAVQNGIYTSVTRASGHLQVHVAGYREIRDRRELLIEDNSLETRLSNTLGQADIVSALTVPGLMESDGRSYGIVLQGLKQPDTVRERFQTEFLLEGVLPETNDVEHIALGEKLALNLQVGLGDTVYLYAPGTDGYGASAYIVSGILSLPASERMALSSLLAAQELAAPEAINRLDISFPSFQRETDDRALPNLRTRAQAELGDSYSVETWSELSSDMAGFVAFFSRIRIVLALIFFVLAGLLVSNTVYLSVMERVREFGVLNALGTPKYKVILMVLSESVLLCFTGAVLGFMVGSLLVGLSAQGISFPAEVSDFLAEQGLPKIFYGSISRQQIVVTVLFTFITATLSALVPAFNAGELEPAEAMRFTA